MGRSNQRRHNIREAAETLGVSSEAVRMRVKRGTLASEKGEDGRTYVRLNAEPTTDHTQTQHTDHALVEQLRSENAYLRDQLEEANTRDRENRRLLAAALERVPELPESQEPSDASAQQAPQGDTDPEPGPFDTGAQSSTQRPWWRRIFGGG